MLTIQYNTIENYHAHTLSLHASCLKHADENCTQNPNRETSALNDYKVMPHKPHSLSTKYFTNHHKISFVYFKQH